MASPWRAGSTARRPSPARWPWPTPLASACSPPVASAASTGTPRPPVTSPPTSTPSPTTRWSPCAPGQGLPGPAAHARAPRDGRRAGARLAARLVPGLLHPLVGSARPHRVESATVVAEPRTAGPTGDRHPPRRSHPRGGALDAAEPRRGPRRRSQRRRGQQHLRGGRDALRARSDRRGHRRHEHPRQPGTGREQLPSRPRSPPRPTSPPATVTAQVVVVGAGFGGLAAVKGLRTPVGVTLVDANNFHTFQPLLYQVATAGLDVDDVAYPVRGISADAAQRDDPHGAGHRHRSRGSCRACRPRPAAPIRLPGRRRGAVTNDYGVPGVAEHCLGSSPSMTRWAAPGDPRSLRAVAAGPEPPRAGVPRRRDLRWRSDRSGAGRRAA